MGRSTLLTIRCELATLPDKWEAAIFRLAERSHIAPNFSSISRSTQNRSACAIRKGCARFWTAANPVIVGRVDLTSGEIFFMKQRYQLERGIINFTNPDQTTPDVNMAITTTIKQYNLTLTVVGPIDKLRTSYVSDPPLPPVDI